LLEIMATQFFKKISPRGGEGNYWTNMRIAVAMACAALS